MCNKKNVLISACLIGVECRYDGKCQNIPEFEKKLPKLMEKYNLIPVCPEIFGGMQTPRVPAEIRAGKVVNKNGEDVDNYFVKGALQVLKLAKLYNCDMAILKKRSPSCGSNVIYDGTFSGKLIEGNGKTAKLLKDNGIRVYAEDEVSGLVD